MSVQELKLEGKNYNMYVEDDRGIIVITLDNKAMSLDRNQAHLLMLYLQEHLK